MKLKLVDIKHKSTFINVYHINIGLLKTKQTCIYKTFLGIPYKVLDEYRETYYGEIIDNKNIILSK